MLKSPPLDAKVLEAWSAELTDLARDLVRTAPDPDALYEAWNAKLAQFGWFSQQAIDAAAPGDQKLMLWWDGLVFELEQGFSRSAILRDRIRAGTFPPPPPEKPLDEDIVLETWFEDQLGDHHVTVNIRRETLASPWRIAVGLHERGDIRRYEVPIPEADQAGFRRSDDAHARGLQLARMALAAR